MTHQKGKAYRSKEETLEDTGLVALSDYQLKRIYRAMEIYATQEKDRQEGELIDVLEAVQKWFKADWPESLTELCTRIDKVLLQPK